MSADGQRTKWCKNIGENFNRLSKAHERYRQTTDGRMTTYSERSLKIIEYAHGRIYRTRNSSGDEIANVNFLYDDIVHAVKIQ